MRQDAYKYMLLSGAAMIFFASFSFITSELLKDGLKLVGAGLILLSCYIKRRRAVTESV